MKLSLTKTNNVPPEPGFRYVFPEDGYVAQAWTYDAWINVAKHHLQANNKPVPDDLEEQMQNQLCQTLPPGWCDYDDPQRPRISTDFSWTDMVNGLKVFASWIADGCSYVSQEEATRRALICSRCYMNVNVEGCGSCQKLAAEVTKSRSTKYDFALKACAVCHCLLKAKVWFPTEILDRSNVSQELYPDFCWNRKDGQNYRG